MLSSLYFADFLYGNDGLWKRPLSEQIHPSVGEKGGRLIMASTSDPRSFNPVMAKETSTTQVTSLMFEGLTRVNEITLEIEPNIAESWQVDSAGKIWTFKLRKDILWSDGEPFTADDVVFTFDELVYNPDIPSSSRDIFTINGEGIEAVKIDTYTVEFRLPFKFAPFLMALAGQEILPKHKLSAAVAHNEFNHAWGIDAELQDIVGTGPFKLARYIPGESIAMDRNPHYWKRDEEGNQLPYLEEVVFVILSSQDTALLKFMDGELDYYGMRGSDFPVLAPLQEERNFTVYNAGPSMGSNFLVLNMNPLYNPQNGDPYVEPYKLKWFKDLNFRRAIAYGIDRESIINIVMDGFGEPQYSPMGPSAGFFYNPNIKKYEYNPKRAKKLLADMGLEDRDGDGILEDSIGRKVEFTLSTNSGNPDRLKIAAIVRKDLSELGMKVNFMPLEFNSLVSKLASTFNWETILIGLTGGIEPHFGKNVWASSGTLHMWYPYQKRPATEWEARIDEIFNQAAQEMDRRQRKKLYDQWQLIVSEELPLIYTVTPEVLYAIRNRFGNLYPTVYGGPFSRIEYLYIKSKHQ